MLNSRLVFWRFCLPAMLICAVLSCDKVGYDEVVVGRQESPFPIKVYVDEPVMMGRAKSSFADAEMNRLTDLNVFIYHDGKLLDGYGGYYGDVNDVMLAFPQGVNELDIYMLGNVGEIMPPECEGELEQIRHIVRDYGEFRDNGVPVMGVFTGFCRGDLAEFPLKRLVGQFDVRMRVSAVRADYRVKDVRVMNCAGEVWPFSENKAASVFLRPLPYDNDSACDVLTRGDIETLNAGGSVPLYFVENLQGELLPENVDPRAKVPASLPKELADRCTYIEITADVTTPAAKYTDCRFRFYPGKNETTDFSIVRNTRYEVALDFTQNMICEEDWRIEADEPEVATVLFSKECLNVSPYKNDTVYVYSPAGDIQRIYDLQTNIYTDEVVEGLTIGCHPAVYNGYEAYMFVVAVDGDLLTRRPQKWQYGRGPDSLGGSVVVRSVETYNDVPLITKWLTLNCYNDVYPLLLKLEKRPGEEIYRVALRGYNPMKHEISVSAKYVYSDKTASVNEKTVVDISEQPVYIGALNVGVTPKNLTRIDFTVKIDGVPFQIGDDCKVVYGPDSDMYPSRFERFPDDGTMRILYTDAENSGIPLTNGKYKDVLYVEIEKLNSAQTVRYFSNRVHVHYPDNDYSKQFVVRGVNSRPVTGAPFYFANGCLESYRVHATRGEMVKYPKKATSGADVYYWGPGRDLFAENEDGDVVDPTHIMGFWIAEWTNLANKYKSQLKTLYYSGQLYMTINNCSCWPGADASKSGCYPDEN